MTCCAPLLKSTRWPWISLAPHPVQQSNDQTVPLRPRPQSALIVCCTRRPISRYSSRLHIPHPTLDPWPSPPYTSRLSARPRTITRPLPPRVAQRPLLSRSPSPPLPTLCTASLTHARVASCKRQTCATQHAPQQTPPPPPPPSTSLLPTPRSTQPTQPPLESSLAVEQSMCNCTRDCPFASSPVSQPHPLCPAPSSLPTASACAAKSASTRACHTPARSGRLYHRHRSVGVQHCCRRPSRAPRVHICAPHACNQPSDCSTLRFRTVH